MKDDEKEEKKEAEKKDEKKEDKKDEKKEDKEEKKDAEKKEDAKEEEKSKYPSYPIANIGKKVQTEEQKAAYEAIVKEYPAATGKINQNYKPSNKTLLMIGNPYYDEKKSPWTGNVGSESRLINTTKSYDTSLFDDLNMNADGPQRYMHSQVDVPMDSEIEKAVEYVQFRETPSELGGAPAAAPRNPAWNVTQDTTKPYRYRETYGTMHDNYDTWDTQVKYGKQHLMQNMVDEHPDVAVQGSPKFGTYGTQDSAYDAHEAYVNSIQPVKASAAASLAQKYAEEHPDVAVQGSPKFGTYGTQDAAYDAHETYVNSIQPNAT